MPATCAHSRMVFATTIIKAISSESDGVRVVVPITRTTSSSTPLGGGRCTTPSRPPGPARVWKCTNMAAPNEVSVRICSRAALSCRVYAICMR